MRTSSGCGETKSSSDVAEIGVLRLHLSWGLDVRGCRLLQRHGVVPWWQRGSYATNPNGVGRTHLRRVGGCVGQRLKHIWSQARQVLLRDPHVILYRPSLPTYEKPPRSTIPYEVNYLSQYLLYLLVPIGW